MITWIEKMRKTHTKRRPCYQLHTTNPNRQLCLSWIYIYIYKIIYIYTDVLYIHTQISSSNKAPMWDTSPLHPCQESDLSSTSQQQAAINHKPILNIHVGIFWQLWVWIWILDSNNRKLRVFVASRHIQRRCEFSKGITLLRLAHSSTPPYHHPTTPPTHCVACECCDTAQIQATIIYLYTAHGKNIHGSSQPGSVQAKQAFKSLMSDVSLLLCPGLLPPCLRSFLSLQAGNAGCAASFFGQLLDFHAEHGLTACMEREQLLNFVASNPFKKNHAILLIISENKGESFCPAASPPVICSRLVQA